MTNACRAQLEFFEGRGGLCVFGTHDAVDCLWFQNELIIVCHTVVEVSDLIMRS